MTTIEFFAFFNSSDWVMGGLLLVGVVLLFCAIRSNEE